MKKLEFDKTQSDIEIANWQALINQVNEFSAALKAEGIILSSEVLSSFMSDSATDPITGADRQSYLATLLVEETLKMVTRNGTKATSLMLRGYSRDANDVASEFNKYRGQLRIAANKVGIGVDAVHLKDGKAIILETKRREIAEKHTNYLRDEDIEMYESLKKLSVHLNTVSKYLPEKLESDDFTLLDCLSILAEQDTSNRSDLFLIEKNGEVGVNDAFFGARQRNLL